MATRTCRRAPRGGAVAGCLRRMGDIRSDGDRAVPVPGRLTHDHWGSQPCRDRLRSGAVGADRDRPDTPDTPIGMPRHERRYAL